MKLKGEIFIKKIGNETFAVVTDDMSEDVNNMIKCNDCSAFILSILRNEMTLDEIAKEVTNKYFIDIDTAKQDAKEVLDTLIKAGFIEE